MIKTDYDHHEGGYQRKQNEGNPQWSDQPQLNRDRRRLGHLLSYAEVPQLGNCLELGCGTGDILIWLHQQGYDCTGVDISHTAIESARGRTKNLNGIQFQKQDITRKPMQTINEYSVIVENWFLHCIIGEDREILLKHIHALLQPGGVFVGATMCGEVQGEIFDGHFNPETRLLTRHGIAIRHIGTEESLLSEFSAAGFATLTHGIKHLGKETAEAEELYFLLQKQTG